MLMGRAILELAGLAKTYPGGTEAVKPLDYSLEEGMIAALLGPNGAGKSTTMGMICGLCIPTGGSLRFRGEEASPKSSWYRKSIGLVSQHHNLELDLTARQNLRVHGMLYALELPEITRRSEDLLSLAGLTESGNREVRTFSGGMKRRLQIIRALLHEPELIILDEPTVGLDPAGREQIWDLVEELNRFGRTVLFSTHYMEEAARHAGRVSIMDRGTIIADAPPDELIGGLGRWCRLTVGPGVAKRVDFFTDEASAAAYVPAEGEEMILRRTTLEDLFINMTGKGLEE
jgi:ABC-2 type transport system ATP-binding protein